MIMNKKVQLGLLALTLMQVYTVTLAAPQYCISKVTHLQIESNGVATIYPLWRNTSILVCNINQTMSGITPQVCASWLTLLRSAVTNKETVAMWYPDAPACSIMPAAYSSPLPGLIQLVD